MSAAVIELNKVIDSVSESQIDKMLSYTKFIEFYGIILVI